MRRPQRCPTLWGGRSMRGIAVVLLCTCVTVVPICAQNLHDPQIFLVAWK